LGGIEELLKLLEDDENIRASPSEYLDTHVVSRLEIALDSRRQEIHGDASLLPFSFESKHISGEVLDLCDDVGVLEGRGTLTLVDGSDGHV